MYKAGDFVKWMSPLDADYSYGYILKVDRGLATVIGTGYYSGVTTEVHLRYIEKAMRGGVSVERGKKYTKRSAP